MPYSNLVHKVYIADGFSEDCEELIRKCVQLETLTFYNFCNLWKDLNFGCLYWGRLLSPEIAELSEELIYVAKRYMINEKDDYKESIAGLFLVYALITTQPFPEFARLRLIPDDVKAVKKIEEIAREESRFDVLYILGTVLVKYTYCNAVERDRGLDNQLRKYMDGTTNGISDCFKVNGVLNTQGQDAELINGLGVHCKQYTLARDAVLENMQSTSTKYINKNIAEELMKSLHRTVNELSGNEKDEAEAHYSAVQTIKNKAMTSTVTFKHQKSSEDRRLSVSYEEPTKELNISPMKSDIKSKAGKIKTCSPIKTVTSSPLKRKLLPSKSKVKKAKIVTKVNSNHELHSDSSSVSESKKLYHELDLTKFDKAPLETIKEVEQGLTNPGGTKGNTKDHPGIPTKIVLDNTEHTGYEIEIIDYKNNEKVPEESVLSQIFTSNAEIGEDISSENDKTEPSTSNDTDTDFDFKTMRTRNSRRVTIQNRFKKIGLWSIKNLNKEDK